MSMIARATIRFRYVVSCLLLSATTPLAAQSAGALDTNRRTSIGIGGGMGNLPSAFRPTCGAGTEGKTPAASADFRIGRRFGALRLETSTIVRGAYVLEDCLYIGPAVDDGVQTIRTTDMDRDGGLTLTDLRVSRVGGGGHVWWLIGAGAGWTWTHQTPVLLVGGGVRLGGRLRFALDAELHRYRIRWNVTTAEWRDGAVVREISRRHDYDWRSGVAVRLGIEVEL